jgi:predicted dehydrogenase
LGWVATDFIAPAMVKNPTSQLAACLGSSVEKGQAFAERFGVARVHRDLQAFMHDPDVDAVYIAFRTRYITRRYSKRRAAKSTSCAKNPSP